MINLPITPGSSWAYRRACRRIHRSLDAGDLAQAKGEVTGIRAWLRNEIRTGPSRLADGYVRDFDYYGQVSDHIGVIMKLEA